MAKQNVDKSFLNGMVEISPGVWQKAKTTLQPREVAKLNIQEGNWNGSGAKRKPHKELLQEIVPQISPEGSLVFKWEGKDLSLNKWYDGTHWTKKNKLNQEWHQFFKNFILPPYPFFQTYTITLHCNSRIDPSNLITLIKLCEDAMQELGVIKGDSAEFCKGVHIIPNESMKRKSYQITISQ